MTEQSTNAPEDLDRARRWLLYAVEQSGEPYLQARATFLDHPKVALEVLGEGATHPDWRHALTARAIAARINAAPTVALAEEFLVGKGLPPAKNVLGKHLPATLGRKIADLGEAIDPWLFEALFKVHRWRDADQGAVLVVAIMDRKSPALLPALLDIAVNEAFPVEVRASAVLATVRTGDANTQAQVHALVQRADLPPQIRVSALFALAERSPNVPQGFRETCESLLLDASAPAAVRAEAVTAIQRIGVAPSFPVIQRSTDQENDEAVLQPLCTALRDLADPQGLEPMREILAKVRSPEAKQLCSEDLADLESTLAHKRGRREGAP